VEKVKLAFVYDAIYPFVKGGAEKRNYELSKRLVKKGYEVHIYGMKWWEGEEIIEEENVYLHGICKSKPLYTKEGRRSIWQAIYFGIHCFKLIKEDFTILECCGFPYFSLFTCKLISIIRRKKLFSTWHEVWGKNYWKEYLGKLSIFGIIIEKLSILMPDIIIAVSDTSARRIIKELSFEKPLFIIPNGIDYGEIKKISPSHIESDIVYAGRLIDFKHVDVLIRAVFLIKEKLPSVRCMIIGDGPQRNLLEELTKELHLQENILFPGFLETSQDVLALLKSSKVFVLPSTREGFGIVILEANASGLPVITIKDENNAAVNLIENGKNGMVCSLNEEDIAEKVNEILTVKRIVSKDCMDCAKQYDWDKNVDKIKGVFKLCQK
jgi:glycosyltransferase involved in cell wall biosynthesis